MDIYVRFNKANRYNTSALFNQKMTFRDQASGKVKSIPVSAVATHTNNSGFSVCCCRGPSSPYRGPIEALVEGHRGSCRGPSRLSMISYCFYCDRVAFSDSRPYTIQRNFERSGRRNESIWEDAVFATDLVKVSSLRRAILSPGAPTLTLAGFW